ncbi:LOW QUALITY PROTEIN: mitochondrial inner membrane protein OXA1L [Anas platyrhynchos]|uniref:LOW QUALITY PROTEIN: mitochondrial inner membrane protein OXA1L n=1 Tax=Anas platyrhynchos TaxID=8839 RepID=UPI003AF1FB76
MAAALRLRPLLRALRQQLHNGAKWPRFKSKRPQFGSKRPGFGSERPRCGAGGGFGVRAPRCGVGGPRGAAAGAGAGGLDPVGLVQGALQGLHLHAGLPWWAAIVMGTLGARVLLLPLVLRGQREAARLGVHLPQLQRLHQRLAEARRGSDRLQVTRAYAELAAYQRRHDVHPLRGFLVPLVQTPLFVSFFLALQQMAAAPHPGLQRGGLGWFPDLTAPDPFYALPLLVTASTWLVLELGAETGVSSPGAGAMRQVLRVMPLLVLPFVLHFPTAVFLYWLTSNSFSLLQTGLLRVPALRARLRVPAPPPRLRPAHAGLWPRPLRGGILGKLRQNWREAQAAQRGEEREWRLRHHLELAAKGPLRQTFSHNPLATPAPPTQPAPPKRPWKETLG